MSKTTIFHSPVHYRIRFKGCLGDNWLNWFEKMSVRSEGSQTILEGPVADQAALRGLLAQIGDLNLTLVSVERLEAQSKKKRSLRKEEK